MKRIISLILCIILAVIVPCTAYADGDGNMNGGGGNMGDGTGSNIWHDGEDGVRVTVIRAKDGTPVSAPIDLTNRNESSVAYFFIKKCKLHYRNGSTLQGDFNNKYAYIRPQKAMPKIISGGGNTNIAAIKSYFTDELVIRYISKIINCSYETLTNGDYKLLIEPIAYFTFQGKKYAMTATEAAMYDQKLSGGLRKKLVSLTHQNLPLSLFLEKSDMGWPAWGAFLFLDK